LSFLLNELTNSLNHPDLKAFFLQDNGRFGNRIGYDAVSALGSLCLEDAFPSLRTDGWNV
jgi:hypothetical protein